MTQVSVESLPLGDLVKGERFARKFQITDVPEGQTPVCQWAKKTHPGTITLEKLDDKTWQVMVTVDSDDAEGQGNRNQSIRVQVGEEQFKVVVSYTVLPDPGHIQPPPPPVPRPSPRPTPSPQPSPRPATAGVQRRVVRRPTRPIILAAADIYLVIGFMCFVMVSSVLGGPVSDMIVNNAIGLYQAGMDMFFDQSATPQNVAAIPSPTTVLATNTPEPPTITPVPSQTPLPTATHTLAPPTTTPLPTSNPVVCSSLLPTRLAPGTTGTVSISGTSALRLRLLPSTDAGTVIGMTNGTSLTVLSGPTCANGYQWWQIQLTTGEIGWAAENDSQVYYLAPNP